MSSRHRLGIVGLGYAGREMAAAAHRSNHFDLRAVADPSTSALEAFEAAGVSCTRDIAELLDIADIDIVYVATPTRLHHQHALEIAESRRHAIVEKPLAANMRQGAELVAAFESRGLVLVVGHSHSFDAPARHLRAAVEADTHGKLLAIHNWCFTDWVQRPRKPEDLEHSLGGGVSLRQGAHQFDILRLVAGGLGQRVHATAIPLAGASGDSGYSAIVEFADDVTATAVYCGRGGFDSRMLSFGVGEASEFQGPVHPRYQTVARGSHSPAAAPMFGFTLATFEKADIVPSPWGLLVHRPGGEVDETPYPDAVSGWDSLLEEARAALAGDRPVVHTGSWGLATLEMCLAVGEAASGRRDVVLKHQVAPNGRQRA